MAASLVAAIHAGSDIPVTLVGGHDGIYEVTVDGNLVHTNQGSCAQGFPSDAEIVSKIADRLGFEPAKALVGASVATSADGPSCALPAEPGDSTRQPTQPDGSCGCSPAPDESITTSCCGPAEPTTENTSSCC